MRVRAVRSGRLYVRQEDVPGDVLARLLASCEHVDQSYRSGRGWSPIVTTYTTKMFDGDVHVGLPAGAAERLVSELRPSGHRLVIQECVHDEIEMHVRRGFDPRPPQRRIADLSIEHGTGVFRVATGVGKTEGCLMAIAERRRRAMIVVPDVALLAQWHARAEEFLGMPIGRVGGGDKAIRDVTIAVPDTICADEGLAREIWSLCVESAWVDECQGAGTMKVMQALDAINPSWCYGLSADERRDDGLDEVAADWVGPVRYEVTREQAVAAGWILPVTVILVPTEHGRRLSGAPPSSGRGYDEMLRAMASDSTRETLLDDVVMRQLSCGLGPVVALCHRREHAQAVSRRWTAGKLLGGRGDRAEFRRVLGDLRDGSAQFAAGTLQSMGVGKDVRGLRTVVVATPFGRGWRRGFNQVMGRVCRVDAGDSGKRRGYVIVLEDRRLYRDRVAEQVLAWTGVSTEVRRWSGDGWEILRRR